MVTFVIVGFTKLLIDVCDGNVYLQLIKKPIKCLLMIQLSVLLMGAN